MPLSTCLKARIRGPNLDSFRGVLPQILKLPRRTLNRPTRSRGEHPAFLPGEHSAAPALSPRQTDRKMTPSAGSSFRSIASSRPEGIFLRRTCAQRGLRRVGLDGAARDPVAHVLPKTYRFRVKIYTVLSGFCHKFSNYVAET